MLSKRHLRPILIGAAAALLFSTRALASFHLWDFSEIYTNADGTIQFIEFSNGPFNGENFLEGVRLTSNSTTGYVLPCCDLVGNTSLKSFLVATAGFAALPGAVTPDYVMPDNFIAVTGGDTLTLVGADTFSFLSGLLPTDGVLSLNRNLTTGQNSPTNFAGATGIIDLSGPALDPANVFVDFNAGPGGAGTEPSPFNTLQAALNAAVPPATINIEPGASSETFSGPGISDELTLVNSSPGGGSVIIGPPPARSESRSGFRSRPIKSTP